MFDMGKFKFISTSDSSDVEMTLPGDSSVDDLCETFERFLKASGFMIDGMTVELREIDEDDHSNCGHDYHEEDNVVFPFADNDTQNGEFEPQGGADYTYTWGPNQDYHLLHGTYDVKFTLEDDENKPK